MLGLSALAQGESMIRLEHLPLAVQQVPSIGHGDDLLAANGGNICATAAQQGISRTTLYKKLGR